MQGRPRTATTTPGGQTGALDRLRVLVMRDAPLQDALAQIDDGDRFVRMTVAAANAHGIALAADDLPEALRPDPIGIARWNAAPATGAIWPPPTWLPVHLGAADGAAFIDWACFGEAPLSAPFFESSARRALARPFNRVFRYRMTLDDFVAQSKSNRAILPSGLIFHMSRCGSTLVSQMLAALPENLVVSEAPPIDAAVRLDRALPGLPGERHLEALIAMFAAFGRYRGGKTRHYVIKLDCWHMLAAPLLRRALPSVPWAFLYRDPVEVLVSQKREPGMQMVPSFVPMSLYGIERFDGIEDYHARVLASICRAALAQHRRGGGLLVDYRQLPQAVFGAIMPHFGIDCSEDERLVMTTVTRRDAKAPSFDFVEDSASKQMMASAALRALAERHLGEIYRHLEAARASG